MRLAAVPLGNERQSVTVLARNRRGLVTRTAVDDDVFDDGVILRENAVDGRTDEFSLVVGWCDNRHEGLPHPCAPENTAVRAPETRGALSERCRSIKRCDSIDCRSEVGASFYRDCARRVGEPMLACIFARRNERISVPRSSAFGIKEPV